jgi:hypothetical protein
MFKSSNFKETFFMQPDIQSKHTLRAWIGSEFVPTLHVAGEINTNGEKPEVILVEATPQGINPKDLLLNMHPDVYDPNGKARLTIKEFTKTLQTGNDYDSVTITTKKEGIHLEPLTNVKSPAGK